MSIPMNDGGPETNRLYAWLSNDRNGVEGVIAVPQINGGVYPLVCTSLELALSPKMVDAAMMASMARNSPARLVEFLRGEVLDTISPSPMD